MGNRECTTERTFFFYYVKNCGCVKRSDLVSDNSVRRWSVSETQRHADRESIGTGAFLRASDGDTALLPGDFRPGSETERLRMQHPEVIPQAGNNAT